MPSGPWGDFLCKAWFSGTLLWGCINTSIVNLTLLTLERYFGVCHPIWHHNNVTTNKAIIAMVTTWVIGHLAESPWGWPTHQSIDGECVFSWPSVSYSIFVGVELFVIEYLIPVSVMIYSYVNILRALKVSPVNQPTGINNVEVTLRDKQKLERAERLRWNVIKMLLIVVIWYIICFTPNIFGFDLWFLTFRQYLDLGGVFYNMSVAMAFCNMCVNPFIYAIKYEEFQIALKKRLPCGALNGSNDVRMLGDSAIDTNTSGI
ncbi:kappa-type opioid receptor-like [Saccoglossus kowalevskii]|uniref:Kappa-type opioid receptor-like n=1 Tax=Saccoglossus kowalevskii TaxID=10224 RepID=A0ABM0MEZ5_SACKO|nr:PREDICTED: kappa-type opioid receptor-like [Saccoglossus kowalevskii]